MATVSSRGGLATLNPLENPVSVGMGRAMGLAQQAMSLPYTVKNLQADIALKKAQAEYNMGRGSYYDQFGNLKTVQAENQAQGTSGNVGQQVLLAQNILKDPSATPEQIQFAKSTLQRTSLYGSGPLPNNLTTQGWQAGQMQQNQNMNPEGSPFGPQGINQSPNSLFQTEKEKIQSQIAANQAEAARNQAEATMGIPASAASNIAGSQEKVTNAVNKGSPFGYDVTPDLNQLQNQLKTIQQQQAELPKGNFISWTPAQQENYIANNDLPPPLPPGTAITEKVDPKSEARMNGMPASAASLAYIKNSINDPDIAPYIGKQAPEYINRAMAEIQRTGEIPPSYSKYLALKNTADTFVADTIATTQTGSRSFGMMQQFQKSLGFGQSINLNQVNNALNQAGNILYDESNTYIGAPYEPGLREAAFNGAKILQANGFAPPMANENNQQTPAAQSSPPPGLSKEQFMQWMQANGGQ